MDAREAIIDSIRICKDRNILVNYLAKREGEVMDILKTSFSYEDAIDDEKKRADEAEKERDETRGVGHAATETLKAGKPISLEEIVQSVGVDPSVLK